MNLKLVVVVCLLGYVQSYDQIGRECMLGEIKWFAGNRAPTNWLKCDGRLMAIRDNVEFFSVVGNAYGGDGRTTFAIPDLRGRVPMGVGAGAGLTNRRLGQKVGAESVILDVTQLPSHGHTLRGSNTLGNQDFPGGNILARSTNSYISTASSVSMGSSSVQESGSDAPHANVQPSTVLTAIICVDGYHPYPF